MTRSGRRTLTGASLALASIAAGALAVLSWGESALGAPDAKATATATAKAKATAAAATATAKATATATAKATDAGPAASDASPGGDDAESPSILDDPDAGAPSSDDAGAPADLDGGGPNEADAGSMKVSCVEQVPEGAARPDVVEILPDSGLSGYAIPFTIIVGHGKGETVLPEGFRVRNDSDTGRALETAGFVVPDQDGGSPASITREEKTSGATTRLTIPIVALPPEAGRNVMILPPMPIAVQRASGSFVTVCTKPHRIRIEDPTANEANPEVKPNPPPRSQREEWVLAKQVSIGVLIGAILTAIALVVWSWWKKRPKPVKLPPKKLPWVQAFEELAEIRESDLLAEGKADIYYERVSNTVRKYLGARYGFDGLERTTDEMKSILRRIRPAIEGFSEIVRFLEDSDLVKFARFMPSDTDCKSALARGQSIVHMTIPPQVVGAPNDKEAP